MIQYKDFVPQTIKKKDFFGNPKTVETIQASLETANQWINNKTIEIINVETIILPNRFNKDLSSISTDAGASTVGETVQWLQFIQVWYKTQSA